ncbi:hypothetical protein GS8_1295 [Geobacillus stearothermophilus]|uniref:Uncharacterized protein n=1 Tax=Geobacillus stearothermophilus TaxID=1422 RepID=A0ABQ7HHP8_GEOSE|nr:hypothetical protein GS8_1295 [Geobacillus stearothermophilus]
MKRSSFQQMASTVRPGSLLRRVAHGGERAVFFVACLSAV